MSFQALARTWRPRRFDQVVGQEHVVRALTHALDENKLHHALLFSGTRGVGKTTLARIIAKCLNCDRGVSSSPCVGEDACQTCREIDEGRYVDLIEVDAASRTGVDDTRELMDNVQYAPTRGRTKVYLIDEVHMLTRHSFNALLKTLEEPPPRVQFLLATTEPDKIPVTILSRCLQFPLKRLPVRQLAGHLRHIVDTESLTADEAALDELARAADGSVRDSLSLLDQAIAFGGGQIVVDQVRDMLGTVGEARVAELVDAIIDARAGDALEALDGLYAQGIDMRHLLDALATAWQWIATIQIVHEPVNEESARWRDQAARVDPRQTQLLYDITLAGIRDLPNAPEPLVGARMCVLRMLAFAPSDEGCGNRTPPTGSESEAPRRSPAKAGPAAAGAHHAAPAAGAVEYGASASQPPAPHDDDAPSASVPVDNKTRLQALRDAAEQTCKRDHRDPEPKPVPTPEAGAEIGAVPVSGEDQSSNWYELVARLSLQGFAAQLASHAVCRRFDRQRIELEVARSNALLVTDEACKSLQQALSGVSQANEPPRLKVRVVDQLNDTPAKRDESAAEKRRRTAVASMENDPNVQKLRTRLGARLRTETVKPHQERGEQ